MHAPVPFWLFHQLTRHRLPHTDVEADPGNEPVLTSPLKTTGARWWRGRCPAAGMCALLVVAGGMMYVVRGGRACDGNLNASATRRCPDEAGKQVVGAWATTSWPRGCKQALRLTAVSSSASPILPDDGGGDVTYR